MGLTGLFPFSIPLGVALGFCLVAAGILALLHGRAVGFLPVVALAGGLAWNSELESRRPPAELDHFVATERPLLRLVGTIEEGSLSLDEAPGESWIVALDSAWTQEGQIPLRGKFRLAVTGGGDFLEPGDQIEAFGRWHRPLPPSNPHEIARDRREFRREIWGSLECSPGCIQRVSRPSFSWRRGMHRLRTSAMEIVRERFSPDAAAIAAPLLLGIWPRQPQDSIDLFRKTGAIHLLAVSGMHVSLLFGGATLFAFRRSRRRRWLVAMLGGFLLFYTALTGFQPPVLRASIMLGLASIAWTRRRPADGLSTLGASAAIVALLFPAEVEGSSFQLSFAATAGMILFGPAISVRLRSWLPAMPWLAKSLGTSLGAFGASLGIVVLHYRILPLASIPATLLATPFLAPLMILGYAALLLPAMAASSCVAVFGWLQTATLQALYGCEFVFGDPISLCGIPWFLPAAVGIGALLLGRGAKKAGTAAMLAGTMGMLLWGPLLRPVLTQATRGELRIDILDAGHGNAVVLRLPNGRCLLFDAGSSSRRDLARSVLLPFLDGEGIREIEHLVVSHGDADHWNAIPSLWGSVPISQVFCGEGASRQLGPRLPHAAQSKLLDLAGPLQWNESGAQFLLWRASPEQCLNENDGSLCLLVRYAGRAVLLCGDIEEEGIRALLESQLDWQCDFLLLPHHGLPAEGQDDLLDRNNPQWAIASCGRRFRGEGVAPQGWEKHFRATAKEGAICIKIGRDGACSLETFAGAGMMAAQ